MFGSILGSAASSAFDAYLQNGLMEEDRNQRQEWQRGMYLDQKHWQTDMANNAHQRAVNDMRAAGLNPMLAVVKGGAPVPSSAAGASPGGQAPSVKSDFVNSALATKRLEAEIENIRVDTDKKASERALNQVLWNRTSQEYLTERERTEQERNRVPGTRVEREIDEGKYGAFMRYLNRINPFSNSAGQVFRSFRK